MVSKSVYLCNICQLMNLQSNIAQNQDIYKLLGKHKSLRKFSGLFWFFLVATILFKSFSHSICVCLFAHFFMSFFQCHRIVFLFHLLQGEDYCAKYFPLSFSLERRDLYKCHQSSSLISSIKKRTLIISERASLA